MKDKYLVIYGTILLVVFNLLAILIGRSVFMSSGEVAGIIYSIIFGGAAIFFDVKAGKYFMDKIKERKNKKNE